MKTLIALAVFGSMSAGIMADDGMKMTNTSAVDPKTEFTKLDTNRDSKLTKVEIENYLKLTELIEDGFDKADINKDKKLSHDEFVAWFQAEDINKEYSSARVEEDD